MTSEQQEIEQRLRRHVDVLASEIGERHIWRYDALQQSARYIGEQLAVLGEPLHAQRYEVRGRQVKNLEVQRLGRGCSEQIVVIGAHYDTVPDTPGANDNGSGVAALLELARLLRELQPQRTLRLVAFVNEEPPFFQTEQMGSLVYARRCERRREQVVGMLSLETIGYYSDERGSQRYPFPFSLFYPDTGNFVGVIGNISSAKLVKRVLGMFRQSAQFPSEGASVPGFITGVGWSDHWSFWKAGYRAVMITDTAPFRYRHYHQPQDTPDKIDFSRLARVVAGLASVTEQLTSCSSL
jgi:Zn-dependent M28 family amino/carboxypeptidase